MLEDDVPTEDPVATEDADVPWLCAEEEAPPEAALLVALETEDVPIAELLGTNADDEGGAEMAEEPDVPDELPVELDPDAVEVALVPELLDPLLLSGPPVVDPPESVHAPRNPTNNKPPACPAKRLIMLESSQGCG